MVSGISSQDIFYQQAYQNSQRYAARQQAQAAQQVEQATQQYYAQVAQVQQQAQAQSRSDVSELFSLKSENSSTDGKDDGKISFWSKLGHAIKGGTVNFVKSALGFDKEGNFSLKQLAKNVAIAAVSAVFVAATGGAGLAVLGAAGAVMATKGIVESSVRAAKATTDKEAKDAWEDIGSGTTGLALSVAGVKAGVKQMNPAQAAAGRYDGVTGTGRAFKDLGSKAWQTAKSAKTNLTEAYSTGGWSEVGSTIKTAGESVGSKMWSNLKTSFAAKTADKIQSDKIAEYDTKIKQLQEQASKATGDAKVSIEQQIETLTAEKQTYSDVASVKTYEEAQTKISQAEKRVSDLETKLAEATDRTVKKSLKAEIKAAKSELKSMQDVTNQRVLETRNTQAEYDNLLDDLLENPTDAKMLQAEQLKQQLDSQIKVPEASTHEHYVTQAKTASETVTAKQTAYDTAEASFKTAQKAANKFKATDTSTEAVTARANLKTAQTAYETAASELSQAQRTLSTQQGYARATSNPNFFENVQLKSRISTFNETIGKQYGESWVSGRTVPHTSYTTPTVSKFWRYTTPYMQSTDNYTPYLGTAEIRNSGFPQMATSQASGTGTTSGGSSPTYADYQMLDYYLKQYS